MTDKESENELLLRVTEVLRRYDEAALPHENSVEAAAREWLAAGFTDEEEIEDWLRARCFTAQGAFALEQRGITPEQAALRTRAGTKDYEDTIGYKIINGELSFDEATRIITNAFWNS
jgi:plasmid stability protein